MVAERSLLIFATSAAVDPYINSIVHSVQELNVVRFAIAIIAESTSEIAEAKSKAVVLATAISEQLKALAEGHYRRRDTVSGEFSIEQLVPPDVHQIYPEAYRIFNSNPTEVFGLDVKDLATEVQSRIDNGQWLFDGTALKKNLLVDLASLLLSQQVLRLFSFELTETPTYGPADLIHALGARFLYRNLLESETVKKSVQVIRTQHKLRNSDEIISEACERYHREFDFYLGAARTCARRCERILETQAIKAMVTYRAKDPTKLKEKLKKRSATREYSSAEDALQDIVDLAGVRVALYFPGDLQAVEKILSEAFRLMAEPVRHPQPREYPYEKRFLGYSAVHFRASFLASDPDFRRFAGSRFEIQLASVLMHAWSEVEHDLVYKPLQGDLSQAEHAMLDQVNGLVLAGELALEQLQRAEKERVSKQQSDFLTHYDLASYIVERLKHKGIENPDLARIDLLYGCLRQVGAANPLNVDRLIEPVASSEDATTEFFATVLFKEHPGLKATWDSSCIPDDEEKGGPGLAFSFLQTWVEFEKLLRAKFQEPTLVDRPGLRQPVASILRSLSRANPALTRTAKSLWDLRNEIAHAVRSPAREELIAAIRDTESLITVVSSL